MKAGTFILCALALVAAASWGCSGGGGGRTAAEGAPSVTAGTPQSAQPKQSPGDFVTDNLGQAIRGQGEREWETLAQEQQALISRTTFIRCAQEKTLAVPDSIRVTDTYDTTVDIPGTAITDAPSKAVTVELAWGSHRESFTMHLVAESGAWRWLLDDDAINAERKGECAP